MSAVTYQPVAQAPDPVHLVALSGIHTLVGKIRYACEHNQPNPTPEVVRVWLARYHVTPHEAVVATVVDGWRAERDLSPAPTEQARDGHMAPSTPVSGRRGAPVGVKGFYVAAFLSMLVSIDTSWRFFGDVLHITDTVELLGLPVQLERIVMFAVLEVALVACGYGMRANVIRDGRPGAPRLIAWLLCGLAGYMAWQLSGFADGLARVALGPMLGLVMLDRALGIEKRAGLHRTGTWARVGREMRERLLSRVGLADDTRDALARTRDRAVARAARLALAGRWTLFRQARLARALRAGNVSHDVAARARLLADLATARHASELGELALPSPWHTTGAHPRVDPSHTAADDASVPPAGTTRPTSSAGPAPARTRPRTSTTREPRTPAASKGKGGRPTREEYLARARAALADSGPVTVTARWVQDAVPGISRSMSYVIADALSADPSSTTTDTSTDRAVGGSTNRVPGPGADGPADESVDESGDVSVDTDRSLSLNGGAR